MVISIASSINKILDAFQEANYIYDDTFLKSTIWNGQAESYEKRWIVCTPADLLKRSLVDSINDIRAMLYLDSFPDDIKTPQVGGDNWGRRANYIEIIPRVLGQPRRDDNGNILMRDGMLGAIKMLSSIPPGSDCCPNCLLLCGILPTMMGDGYAQGHKEESSLYTMDIDKGLSLDLSSDTCDSKGISTEDQVKAFNELAHLRGLKTGVFLVISEDQIKVNGEAFRWNEENIEKFIKRLCDLVNLGFDAIYFDSAKHIGGMDSDGNYQYYDQKHYAGVGQLPNYWDMQHITNQTRNRTGRPDISFIGERCDLNDRYEEMGFTAGIGFVQVGDLQKEADVQDNSKSYASGPDITDDNDIGGTPYESRLAELKKSLWNSKEKEKLPVLMTMQDIWPLNNYTNVHELMQKNMVFTEHGDPENDDLSRHQEYVFVNDGPSHWYREEINKEFAWFANY